MKPTLKKLSDRFIVTSSRKVMFTILLFSFFLSSCFQSYYTAKPVSPINAAKIHPLLNKDKYFIIHYPNNLLGLTNVRVEKDSLKGTLEALTTPHTLYYNSEPNNSYWVKKRHQKSVFNEVHLYTMEQHEKKDSSYSSSLNSFVRMDVYELNDKLTRGNHRFSRIGIGIGLTFIGLCVLASGAMLNY